jgi:hypothetical protein
MLNKNLQLIHEKLSDTDIYSESEKHFIFLIISKLNFLHHEFIINCLSIESYKKYVFTFFYEVNLDIKTAEKSFFESFLTENNLSKIIYSDDEIIVCDANVLLNTFLKKTINSDILNKKPVSAILSYSNFDDLNKYFVFLFDSNQKLYKLLFVAEKEGVLHYCYNQHNHKISFKNFEKFNIPFFKHIYKRKLFT